MKRGILALAAFGMVCAGCSAERLPTNPNGPDRVPLLMAFLSERPPSPPFSADIYFYDFRTGTLTMPPNVNTNSYEGPCALSGNGRLMAFFTNRLLVGSTATILLYDVGAQSVSVPRPVNNLSSPENPALSGDGRYLAVQYQVSDNFFSQFVAMEDLRTDSLLPLPNLNDPNATNFDPALNGDGSLVAFSSNRIGGQGGFDIWLYSVPGDSIIPLPGLNSPRNEFSPSISADGRYIAFQSGVANSDSLTDVAVYDRATHSLLPLPGANTDLADFEPAISPDGRYLAWATEKTGGRDIRVYDIRQQRLLRIQGLNAPDGISYDYFPALASP